MLQKSPDAKLETDELEDSDDKIMCARCGQLVTRTRWALSMGGHEHVFFNPAGIVFRINCFAEAPGATDQGAPSDEFSWFKGYLWNFAMCTGCGEHLGWRFTGASDPPVFFGLIKGRLTNVG